MRIIVITAVFFGIMIVSALAQESVFSPDRSKTFDSTAYKNLLIDEGDTSKDSFDYQFKLQANRIKFDALVLGFREIDIDYRLNELKKVLKKYAFSEQSQIEFVLVADSSVIPVMRQLFSSRVMALNKREPFIGSTSKNVRFLPDNPFYALVDINFIPLSEAIEQNRKSKPTLKLSFHPEKRIRINKKGIVVNLKFHTKEGIRHGVDTLWGQDWCDKGKYFTCVPEWANKFFTNKFDYDGCSSFDHLEKIIPSRWDTVVVQTGIEQSYMREYQEDFNLVECYAALIWHHPKLTEDYFLTFLDGTELPDEPPSRDKQTYDNHWEYATYFVVDSGYYYKMYINTSSNQNNRNYARKKFFVISAKVIRPSE